MCAEVQNIHNVMEELVRTEVDRLFDAAESQKLEWLSCTCKQCRGDVVCYVLNKIPAHYVRSGRGVAHYNESERAERQQIGADISAMALEGMKLVSQRKRPHADDGSSLVEEAVSDEPVFNFPAITGRVLDGLSFEPLANVSASLYLDGELCKPLSAAWENPCITNEHTPGNFAFAIKPIPSSYEGERKVFDFEIRVNAEGKDSVAHFIEIGVTGGKAGKDIYMSGSAVVIPDVFLFPIDDKFDVMQ